MAEANHTAPACPSYPPDGVLIPLSDDPPCSAGIAATTQRHRDHAVRAAFAVYAIERLRIDCDIAVRAQASGLPTQPVRWRPPRSPATTCTQRSTTDPLDPLVASAG